MKLSVRMRERRYNIDGTKQNGGGGLGVGVGGGGWILGEKAGVNTSRAMLIALIVNYDSVLFLISC